MNDALKALADAGVSIWIDDLSRQQLTSGKLASLVHDQHVSGATSNPTLFAKAISDKNAYAEQVARLAADGASISEAIRTITTDDVRDAADLLKPVYDDTDGVDGRVSIEVEPSLAHDTEGTIRQAKDLWETVGRENVFVKIPATKEGLPAITAALAAGISINVTLIFSLERYRAVADAFLTGLDQALDDGHDVTKLASVASFFVSRVDTEVDKRLDAIGTDKAKALKGRAAIANARLAFQAYEEIFDTDRWRELETAGAKPQRPLWASTGVKNTAYKSTMYVEELVTRGVVHTMPQATIDAVAESAVVTGDTVHGNYAADREVIDDLEKLGVSYDEVVQVLEDEGVGRFAVSWSDLEEAISSAMGTLGSSSMP